SVAVGWINLGTVLQRLGGRTREALEAYDSARAVLLATVGPDHPRMAALEGSLGRLYHETGDHAGALAHYRAALAIHRKSIDDTHPTVLATRSDIGRCLTATGDYPAAEHTLLDVYAALEPTRDEHTNTWNALV